MAQRCATDEPSEIFEIAGFMEFSERRSDPI
jgi:hypothetical protein